MLRAIPAINAVVIRVAQRKNSAQARKSFADVFLIKGSYLRIALNHVAFAACDMEYSRYLELS